MVKELLKAHPHGLSITDIAQKLGKNKHSVGRYLDILHASGHVDMRTFGMAKVYTLSSRVPLSALLSYTTDLVLVVDKNLRVLQANDTFLSMINLHKEQVIFQDIMHIPAPNPAVLSFLSIIAGKISRPDDIDEIELKGESNQFFHLQTIPTVFDDGTGGTTVICKDITIERQTRDELKESNEFFQDIFENLTDGILVIEENEILFINNRFSEITGYTREDLATMKPCDLATKDERERFLQKYQAMEQHPSSIQDFSFWSQRKDGDSRYLNVRMSEVGYGNTRRYYILMSDMTEQRRRQELENLQLSIISRVVDQFPHPIFSYYEDGTVFLVNDSFCELYGIPAKEEFIGKAIQDTLPADISDSFFQGDVQLLKDGGHGIQSIMAPGPDGVVLFPVEKSVVCVGEGAGRYIFGVILTDCAGIVPEEIAKLLR